MLSLSMMTILICIFVIGLIFALTNGLHDASSMVATFINCGAATPRQAILWASVFGLLGAVFGGSAVANTLAKVIDLPTDTDLLAVLFCAIAGAVIWNLVTWKLGLPSSSTHALIGGIVGAVMVASGSQHVLWGWQELVGQCHQITGIIKVVAALILSPLLGFIVAFILEKTTALFLRNAKFSVNKWLKRGQWISAAALAYSHGANDTQKIIGLLTLALVAGGSIAIETAPLWVRLCGGMVMFTGTMFGGWSIMKTVGRGIYNIRPIHSANSQLASMGSVFLATAIGAPVSTTHVVVGSVMGVGVADQYRMVHWQIVREIIIAWFITIPLAALVSALIYIILFTGIFDIG
jgi:PiT family inorganic phosphate transporter